MQAKKTTDLQGVDISSVQSITNEDLLFSKIGFLICRAYGSDHTGTGDSAFAGFVAKAHTHKCPVGAYYFGTPFVDANNSTDAQLTTQAQTQCQQFIDKLYAVFGTGNVGDLIPFLDLETYTDKYANQGHVITNNAWYPQGSGMTSAQLVTWIKAFRDYFYAHTGRRLGFYTNRYWLTTTDVDANGNKQGMGLTTAQITDINNNNTVPFWLAEYDQWYGGTTGNVQPADLANWTTWNAWQYSGTGVASDYGLYHSANQVDLDRCSDMSWLQAPPLIENWGVTDNQDGTVTVTMTHPTTVDYIGTSLYQDGAWKKWIGKGTTSVTLTGLNQGQTYTFKLVSEDNNHDFTSTADKTLTIYDPTPPITTTADPNATPDPTATTTTTTITQPTIPQNVIATPAVWGTVDVTQYPALQQSRYFTFNGLDSRNFGFLINDILRPYFPPLQITTIGVPNRAGALAVNRNEWGVRNIEVDITIMGDNFVDLRQKVRNLAGFLVYMQDVALIFSDEPNLQYNARFNQSATSLDEIAETGAGKLIFSCFDPLAYSTTEQTHLLDTAETGLFSYTVHNAGTAPTYPRLRAIPSADCSFIKFTNVKTGKSITYNAVWKAWDSLIIDCKNNLVYREADKLSFLENITLDSEFFELVAGDNKITVSNQDATAGTGLASQCRVYWTEAYY
jgi:lysozyme